MSKVNTRERPSTKTITIPAQSAPISEGSSLWLAGLIFPFGIPENQQADLLLGSCKGKKFKFHYTDIAKVERKVMERGG